MKIEQMEQIVEIARTGSISEAAACLFLSQSSLSHSVKTLEKELGTAIFLRTNRGVVLTPFGREFVSYSKNILLQIDQLRQVSKKRERTMPKLSVETGGYRFVVAACAELARRYSATGIQLTINDGPSGYSMLEHISREESEVGIITMYSNQLVADKKQLQANFLEFFPLARVPVSIVVGRGNPLFHSDRQSISREELKNFARAVPQHIDSGLLGSRSSDLRLPEPKSLFVASNRAAIYTLMESTDAYFYSAVPLWMYEGEGSYPALRSLVLEDCDITAEIGWIKHEKDPLSPLARELVEIFQRMFCGI